MRLMPWLGAATCVLLPSVFSACGDDDSSARSTTAATAPLGLTVAAEPSGPRTATYRMPASVKAGLTRITFANNTTAPREADLVRVDGSHTEAEVVAVLDSADGAPIPAWIHGAGGVASLAPGASATSDQVLAPGHYLMTDSTDPDSHAKPAKPRRFEVRGPAVKAPELPTVRAQITAREYGFTLSGLKSGRNRVHFANTGRELHHALFFAERAGATRAEVLKFFTTQGNGAGRPPVDFTRNGATPVLDGGTEQNTDLVLKPGKYAVLCFLRDRAGGPPHVAKGMFTELAVK